MALKFRALKQKGAYPYEYMDSLERFNEEKLLNKKLFYSSVKNGTTDDNGEKLDWSRKQWRLFDVQENVEWILHEKYGWLSQSLFEKRFFKFIDTCLKFYRLDPCHYFSSPGLSWDAMLKMTGVKLEKIIDIDMYLFIEKRLAKRRDFIYC